jgi:hypothetical protein
MQSHSGGDLTWRPGCRTGTERQGIDRQQLKKGKKEAPAIDEGEEARLCGGLWTSFMLSILSPEAGVVNGYSQNFEKKYRGC